MDVEDIVEVFECAGYEVRSYSGRGMYGNECLGVTCDDPVVFTAKVMAVASAYGYHLDDLLALFSKHRTDDMGLSTIIYFPSVAY